MTDYAIEVRGLKKTYGDLEALRGIDLTVENGEVFALLGPNGAGKTTAVEIMEGYRTRSAGDVAVLGFDPSTATKQFRERVGIVLQETGIEPFLTVSEVVDLYRGYYPHPRPRDEIIEVVGLAEKRNERVVKLSGGQQRRLDVAVGLAGDPDLLFLDEPTTGFDPSARRNAWEMIRNLVALGKTVFLTTHYMDEAQSLAGHVAIIVDGRIVAEGPPGSLVGKTAVSTKISFRHSPDLEQMLGEVIPEASAANGRVEVHTDEPMRVLHDLTRWALEQRVELEDLNVSRPSLEDVYLELTSEAERMGAE
ncbi:MAG: ABC transporter ATP-binding protein [Actinomycetota bacterium]|nr:ABC transporter ATP-binding protein [Actinomycetota bacterium]